MACKNYTYPPKIDMQDPFPPCWKCGAPYNDHGAAPTKEFHYTGHEHLNTPNANQMQVGGDHYKAGGYEEHWDRVNRLGLDYFQGQITKYVERAWKKNGIQDLRKARHFLDKYIEIKEGEMKDSGIPGTGYVKQEG